MPANERGKNSANAMNMDGTSPGGRLLGEPVTRARVPLSELGNAGRRADEVRATKPVGVGAARSWRRRSTERS